MADRTKPLALAFARWSLGAVSLMHGLANTFGLFGGPGLDRYVAEMSGRVGTAPELTAYVVAIGELVGGALLLLGPFARLIAGIMLLFVIGNVLLSGRWQTFFGMGGIEYALLLAVPCAIVATHGTGAFAVEIKAKQGGKG